LKLQRRYRLDVRLIDDDDWIETILKPTVKRIAGDRIRIAIQEQLDQLGIAGVANRLEVDRIDGNATVQQKPDDIDALSADGLRLMGVGPTQTSCREERDGADDRNQHPDRVYFGNGRRVFLPSLVEAVTVYITWIGGRQYRQKQNGR
jgi:hypothetical protein